MSEGNKGSASGLEQALRSARSVGGLLQAAGSTPYCGRWVDLAGERLLNFGSTSYLALELREELREGAVRAARERGIQFPFPGLFLEAPEHVVLRDALNRMTEGHVVIAPSVTMAHVAVLPVLLGSGSTLIVDRAAHPSLQMAAKLVEGPVESASHHDIGQLEQTIDRLHGQGLHVWYALDGTESLTGRFAPLLELSQWLWRYPRLRIYVDDAHSTSWLGQCGRGLALEQLSARRDQVVSVLSLNKAFCASGAAVVLSSEEEAERVRLRAGPLAFTGAIPPPMLGAALASVALHLAPEWSEHQRRLRQHIARVLELAEQLDIELADRTESPIFFFRCGSDTRALELASALRYRGFCTCPAIHPIAPQGEAGIRFTVSLHNTEEDIEAFLDALASESKRFR